MVVHGDFSRGVADGFAGVLFQQGRVFLDTDGTAQTLISNAWQDTAARDTFGADIAAASADDPDAFKVTSAAQTADGVTTHLLPGHIWADGRLIRQPMAVDRVADYLGTPAPAAPAAGDRDAVVLEVWREAISGFQFPELLVEPALGGPDTTERLNTSWDLRLVRLAQGEDCVNIGGKLQDPANKGHLTATLQPTTVVPGDCPVIEGGGYTGFEHNLYRIEIADGAGPKRFKWSQFNGGLVGRAAFVANQSRALVKANFPAIASSGLDSFYLEALVLDELRGRWTVAYSAENVTFDVDSLVLPAPVATAAITTPASVFIRLWNGILRVSDFPKGAANPTELRDGIRLEFDPEAAFVYQPGDYWTFSVRAGEIETAAPLVNDQPPEGIVYHRVPLAELTWDGSPNAVVADDCRHVVPPLGRAESCCTFQVGDGIHSHGDFTTIQAAIDALPDRGGEICVLEGVYHENVLIDSHVGVRICGCGDRSRVVSPDTGRPVFHVVDSRNVHICNLLIDADANGPGVLLDDLTAEKAQLRDQDIGASGRLRFIELINLEISASTRSAIEAHGAMDTVIRGCSVSMLDGRASWPGIFFEGLDSLIERNVIRVRPQIDDRRRLIAWQSALTPSEGIPLPAEAGLGGLQLGGLSERIRVLENVIQGGIGNGITLGSIRLQDRGGRFSPVRLGWVINIDDPCQPCKPGDNGVPDPDPNDPELLISAGPLRDIYIERNRILDMGLNGIGVVGFFNLKVVAELITVERLTILGNEIKRCLQRSLAPVREDMASLMGYGGISLADVERLVLRENVIEDNGPDFLQPVCGVFVVEGEGVEITHNRIVNNGANTGEPTSSARPGPRGGINIALVLPAPAPASQQGEVLRLSSEETPALRVSNNVISAPLGQALVAMVAGPAEVHGNYFTSQGVAPQDVARGFFGATVELRNLGRSREEAARLSFVGMLEHAFAKQKVGAAQGRAAAAGTVNSLTLGALPFLAYFGRVLAAGTTMFNDNQCLLDVSLARHVLKPVAIQHIVTASAVEERIAPAAANQIVIMKPAIEAETVAVVLRQPRATSILIASLDDVSFQDNQCLTDLESGTLLTQALVAGGTVRTMGNRLKEGPDDALLSAITLGTLNTTTENQCTHCVTALPPSSVSNLTIDDRNLIVAPSAVDCAEWSNRMYRAILSGGF